MQQVKVTWMESSAEGLGMEFQLSCTDGAPPLLDPVSVALWGAGWRLSDPLRSCLSPLAARMTVSWRILEQRLAHSVIAIGQAVRLG